MHKVVHSMEVRGNFFFQINYPSNSQRHKEAALQTVGLLFKHRMDDVLLCLQESENHLAAEMMVFCCDGISC